MKNFHRMTAALLACSACAGVLLSGCSQTQDTTVPEQEAATELPSQADEIAEETGEMTPAVTDNGKMTNPPNEAKADGTSDVHITIEDVSVTLEELAAQDYVVPVMITLDENAGISYTEWGVQMDERCRFEADNTKMDYAVYYAIDDDKHFMWTAWSSGAQVMTEPGSLLKLQVIVPEDAAVGDKYTIAYAPVSMANKMHVWNNGTEDWAEGGYVTWTDGSITITE